MTYQKLKRESIIIGAEINRAGLHDSLVMDRCVSFSMLQDKMETLFMYVSYLLNLIDLNGWIVSSAVNVSNLKQLRRTISSA